MPDHRPTELHALFAQAFNRGDTISGLRSAATIFTLAATLPNTFGNFVTITNAQPTAMIDTLTISLSNASPSCCANPMGVDNIALNTSAIVSSRR